MEETQLQIKNLRYFASQPWPYPCGLMVGFMAEYEDGELCCEKSELKKGGSLVTTVCPLYPARYVWPGN